MLRVVSYAASNPIGIERGAAGLERWTERHVLAQRIFPRLSLDERLALVRALGDRCDDADAALQEFVDVHPHYWASASRSRAASRGWAGPTTRAGCGVAPFAVEPHLRELL